VQLSKILTYICREGGNGGQIWNNFITVPNTPEGFTVKNVFVPKTNESGETKSEFILPINTIFLGSGHACMSAFQLWQACFMTIILSCDV
jgi:hypothetical protein